MSSAYRGSLTSSFPVWSPLISLSPLIAMAQPSKCVLNSTGEGGHPCPVPHLSGCAFSLSPLGMILAGGWSDMAFIMFTLVSCPLS